MGSTRSVIAFFKAQKRISVLWFVFSAIIFLLVFIQTIIGEKFDDESVKAVWKWVASFIIPTLSLILSAFFAQFGSLLPKKENIGKFYYLLVFWLSFFYLFIVILVILIEPLIETPFVKIIDSSSYYLTPLQSLVNIAIGYFFIKRE